MRDFCTIFNSHVTGTEISAPMLLPLEVLDEVGGGPIVIPPIVITAAKIAGGATTAGFFGAAGADLYSLIKGALTD